MTTLEYMEKELEKQKNELKEKRRRGAPREDTSIINEKIIHYRRVCRILQSVKRSVEICERNLPSTNRGGH